MKIALLSLLTLAFVSASTALTPGCSTNTGNTDKDRDARVTNAVIETAAQFAGRVALSTLSNAAQTAASGEKIDLAHSAAAGLWAQAPTVVTAADVQRIVQAWSGNQLDTVAAASAAAYRQAAPQSPPERQAVINALAGAISNAAFDATGLP